MWAGCLPRRTIPRRGRWRSIERASDWAVVAAVDPAVVSVAVRSTQISPKRRVAAKRISPVVLDSSCWLEHFADSEQASLFCDVIDAADELVVPVITVCEVVKKLVREAGDEVAAQALTLMLQGRVVDIDLNLSLAAARNGLPLADSLLYATACAHGAEL